MIIQIACGILLAYVALIVFPLAFVALVFIITFLLEPFVYLFKRLF